MTQSEREHLFVYGTLLPALGHSLGLALEREGFLVGAGFVYGKLFDFGEFPVATPEPAGNHRVSGQVFRLEASHPLWQELDDYEGYQPADPGLSEFHREPVLVHGLEGAGWEAWIYWFTGNVSGLPAISQGDYLAFRAGW